MTPAHNAELRALKEEGGCKAINNACLIKVDETGNEPV